MREQSTFPRELVQLNPCAVELLTKGIVAGAGSFHVTNGFWPSFAKVTVSDVMTGASATIGFFLVTCAGVVYYESLFKVQFPHAVEFVVIPVEIDGGPACNRLHKLGLD